MRLVTWAVFFLRFGDGIHVEIKTTYKPSP